METYIQAICGCWQKDQWYGVSGHRYVRLRTHTFISSVYSLNRRAIKFFTFFSINSIVYRKACTMLIARKNIKSMKSDQLLLFFKMCILYIYLYYIQIYMCVYVCVYTCTHLFQIDHRIQGTCYVQSKRTPVRFKKCIPHPLLQGVPHTLVRNVQPQPHQSHSGNFTNSQSSGHTQTKWKLEMGDQQQCFFSSQVFPLNKP